MMGDPVAKIQLCFVLGQSTSVLVFTGSLWGGLWLLLGIAFGYLALHFEAYLREQFCSLRSILAVAACFLLLICTVSLYVVIALVVA